MVFSKNTSHLQQKVSIKINGKLIETDGEKCEIPGINFWSCQTWEKHIDKIVESCKCKINLLRSLTGQHWGTGKRSRLKTYRSLIRPKMEYRIEIFHTANNNAWNKLEVNSSNTTHLFTHSMRSYVRNINWCSSSAWHINPASSVIQDTWQNHYGKYKVDWGTILMPVNKFQDLHSIPKVASYSTAPRNRNTLTTDLMLQQNIFNIENQQTNSELRRNIYKNKKNHLHIYTESQMHLFS